LIGGVVDLDLLFQIPQQDSRNMGGIESNCKLLKVKTMEERETSNQLQGGRRGGVFIPPPIKMTVTASQAGLYGQNWPNNLGGADYPAKTGQKSGPPSD
jgi:hypothetical protein